jgi:phage shock protein PspC (stress-responsive transcriptional regulator)
MNTDTMNPEAPATEPTTGQSDRRPEPHFSFDPERPALRRPFQDRMLAGVAAGLARYFGVDVTIVRIAFVVLTVVGGAGIPLYLAGLLLIPEEGSDQSIAGAIIESLQSRSR